MNGWRLAGLDDLKAAIRDRPTKPTFYWTSPAYQALVLLLNRGPGIRFQRGQFEQHLICHLEQLLNDEHTLRRLSEIEEAGALRTQFATAHLLALQLREIGKREQTLRNFIAGIAIRSDGIMFALTPAALGIEQGCNWSWTIPLPKRRPFREARITIESGASEYGRSDDLVDLLADAMAAQQRVLGSPELSLAQVAKREGRCRTQLTRLLRLSFLAPKIVEAITNGTQPNGLIRRVLLSCDMPIDWAEQERMFGLAA